MKPKICSLNADTEKESEDNKADHLMVSEDIEPAKGKIKAWVDAYNEFQTLAKELTNIHQMNAAQPQIKPMGH